MNIKTNAFHLNRKQLFRVFLWHDSRKFRFWLIVLGVLLVLNLLTLGNGSVIDYVITGVLLFIPLGHLLSLWLWARTLENRDPYKPGYVSVDEKRLQMVNDDGSSYQIPWENVPKVMSSPDYYLVFFLKDRFKPIPKASFQSDRDIKGFEEFLEKKSISLS